MISCSSRQPSFRDQESLESYCSCSKPPELHEEGKGGGGPKAQIALDPWSPWPRLAPQKKDAHIADSQDEDSEADKLVADFCNKVPKLRVLPTEQECDQLWSGCADFSEAQISLAFCKQLSQGMLLEAWPAQVRAMRALAYLLDRGGKRRRVAGAVMASSGGAFVRHLATEVPECRNDAEYLMLVNELAQSLPSGQILNAADHGGLVHFTDKKNAVDSQQKPRRGEGSQNSVDLLGISGQHTPATPSSSCADYEFEDLISLAEVPKAEYQKRSDHGGADLLHLNLEFKQAPECFAIGDDQDMVDNQDLSQMYSFCQRRPPRIPWVSPMDAKNITKSADPFDCLAEHVQLMCS